MMDITTLCNSINLQSEMKSRVLEFASGFDFQAVDGLLKKFRMHGERQNALKELQMLLGEDTDHVRVLACMLKASADLYDFYREKGISDEIYVDTMKCYPRFIGETYRMTGKFCFDREWWTVRQAGGSLFRIGELEYEIEETEHNKVIELHIPSDADFSPDAVSRSLARAERFFAECFPEIVFAAYHCHSWLMDRQLEGMLREESNIIRFQRRFEIADEGEADTGCIEWVFQSRTDDFAELPERTTLQRKMKRHLLSGGVIRDAHGVLRRQNVDIVQKD